MSPIERWNREFEANCDQFSRMIVRSLEKRVIKKLRSKPDLDIGRGYHCFCSLQVEHLKLIQRYFKEEVIPSPFAEWMNDRRACLQNNRYISNKMRFLGDRIGEIYYNAPPKILGLQSDLRWHKVLVPTDEKFKENNLSVELVVWKKSEKKTSHTYRKLDCLVAMIAVISVVIFISEI